jgi:hypothetical protein
MQNIRTLQTPTETSVLKKKLMQMNSILHIYKKENGLHFLNIYEKKLKI